VPLLVPEISTKKVRDIAAGNNFWIALGQDCEIGNRTLSRLNFKQEMPDLLSTEEEPMKVQILQPETQASEPQSEKIVRKSTRSIGGKAQQQKAIAAIKKFKEGK